LDIWVDIRFRDKVLGVIDNNKHFKLKKNNFNFSVIEYQKNSSDTIKIDIFWKISFRGISVVDDTKMYDAIITIDDLNFLTPQAGNALGFVKEVLHTGQLRDEKHIYMESYRAIRDELLQNGFFSHPWLIKSAEDVYQNRPMSILVLYVRLMVHKSFWKYIGAKFREKANNFLWR
jgi:hypothetical protein